MHVCKVFDSFGINPGGVENESAVGLNQTGDIWMDVTARIIKTLADSESCLNDWLTDWMADFLSVRDRST